MDEKEIEKCKDDILYFMEKYCSVDGKPIVLTETSKNFLRSRASDLSGEQAKMIIYGLALVSEFQKFGPTMSKVIEGLDKFPKKKCDISFTWNLK